MRRAIGVGVLLMGLTTTAAAEVTLPADARTGLAVTLYGDGAALVWDARTVDLQPGRNRLAFEGVSRQMLPSSAVLRADAGVRLAEVEYDFALLTPDALLRRSVGREIGVVRTHPTTGVQSVETARLLSVEGGAVLQFADRIETAEPGRLAFREVPAGLRPQPALLASVDSDAGGRAEITLGYLSHGLGWSADYVALWSEAAGRLTLTGRATLVNTSGAAFPEATLSLVAGSVARVADAAPSPRMRGAPAPMMAEAAKAMPAPEALGDVYLYTVPGRVSLADQQTKQVTLLTLDASAVNRSYVSPSQVGVWRASGEPRPTHPEVRLRFATPTRAPAAAPLPAGLVRVYTADAGGTPRLIGEERIEHTPAGGSVTLTPGRAFDLTVTRRQTDFVRAGLPEGVSEAAWAVEINSAKAEAVTVDVIETVGGDWTVLAESAPHEKQTADRLLWRIPVPANGRAQLTYRIRVQP